LKSIQTSNIVGYHQTTVRFFVSRWVLNAPNIVTGNILEMVPFDFLLLVLSIFNEALILLFFPFLK